MTGLSYKEIIVIVALVWTANKIPAVDWLSAALGACGL